jgi:hypothetical protein
MLTAERHTMSTSQTSTADILAMKIEALSVIPGLGNETDWAEEFARLWDISIPLAVGVQLGFIQELSDKGVEEIEKCWLALALTLGKSTDDLMSDISDAKDSQ